MFTTDKMMYYNWTQSFTLTLLIYWPHSFSHRGWPSWPKSGASFFEWHIRTHSIERSLVVQPLLNLGRGNYSTSGHSCSFCLVVCMDGDLMLLFLFFWQNLSLISHVKFFRLLSCIKITTLLVALSSSEFVSLIPIVYTYFSSFPSCNFFS